MLYSPNEAKKDESSGASESLFSQGYICELPEELALASHEFMGQKSFYANLEESDCEESDDELVGEDLTEERFNSQVGELIKAIVTGDIELEVGLINLRQTKHGSDKDNITF